MDWDDMGGWHGMGGWGMGGGWGLLFGVLLLAGLVLLIVLLVRALSGGIRQDRNPPPPSGSAGPESGPVRARQILQERYARGEIDTEEYQERLRNLGES